MMKIIFSELADTDMQDILEYIAQDDLERAVSFTLELEEQIEKLSDYPTNILRIRSKNMERQ